MKKQTNTIKKRASKAVVTQDNRFIYAKYDMNANEMKFFMWIVAQLNSQRDTLFQVCEIPLSEVFEIFNHTSEDNYTYIKHLIDNMAKKAYIEDFRLLDEKTMKEVDIHRAMPLFKWIEYRKEQSHISYQLNDSLMEYLLEQKRDFTQLKFNDIQQMKSAYSIRIYNMLMCEIKQNRQSLKMNLAALQNILEVPKTLKEYKHFNQKVLAQAKKDINTKSNLILFEIKALKTGKKVTDLEFIFDYKNNTKRIEQDEEKLESFNLALSKIAVAYLNKELVISNKKYKLRNELMLCKAWQWTKIDGKKRVAIALERKKDNKLFYFLIPDFKSVKSLQEAHKKAKKRADEMFCAADENIQAVQELREKLQSGDLFKGVFKRIKAD